MAEGSNLLSVQIRFTFTFTFTGYIKFPLNFYIHLLLQVHFKILGSVLLLLSLLLSHLQVNTSSLQKNGARVQSTLTPITNKGLTFTIQMDYQR